MYRLQCLGCGATFADDGLMVRCHGEHAPALLRTVYPGRRFLPDDSQTGIMRYHRWLPLRSPLSNSCPSTAVFQSAALNEALDAPDLWLAFNGYWPERGAHLPTGTFKDLETAAVLARFRSSGRILVSASAGNTAAALAAGASAYNVPAIVVVPEKALPKLRFRTPLASCLRIIVVPGDASYDDAIAFAKSLAASDDRYVFEGGATNVARRDGIGTTMLAAIEKLGAIPEYFVQAIGSGAGAIAAHEAGLRVRADGRFGSEVAKLLLVQNAPSAPVYESWSRHSRELIPYAENERAMRIQSLSAPVLSTQAPPYAITGGLYDALCESGGDVRAADNDEARCAGDLFRSLEGISLEPASAVALAGLVSAFASGAVARTAQVVLHVTGAGRVPGTIYGPGAIERAA